MPFNFLKKLLELILPPRASEREVERLTPGGLLTLQTAEGLPYSDKCVRALVWELKYHANPRAATLAGELLAEELLAIASEELGRPLLVPVPMHKTRRQERGHNQTELLCEAALEVLSKSGRENSLAQLPSRKEDTEDFFSDTFDYAPTALKRTKFTPEQQKLDRTTRLKNVAGSMEANPAVVHGRVCIVVDDVATTGATLAEAARALKAAGARRVHTLTLAQS